jgi:hypothetical protein
MAKARHNNIDFDMEEEEYDEETEYLIDDVLYYINEDMPRDKVFKHLERCEYDVNETVNRIFQIREQKAKKKIKKKEDQLKKKEEELKKKEEDMKKKEEEAVNMGSKKNKSQSKIPWPTSNAKDTGNSMGDSVVMMKRSSVNIESKRKESKRLLSNFKVENNDKSFWNCEYPIIEYPE